jgi:hypothetical protein
MDSKHQNEFLDSLYETTAGLHKISVINDAEIQEYDQDCLVQGGETVSTTGSFQIKLVTLAFTGRRR